jgi:desulfoferrodoxin (superoxide reductase-like protein)
MISRIETLATLDDGSPNFIHPTAFHNDVLHCGDMLHADDKNHFIQAIEDEVAGLRDMFEIVPRTELPPGTKPLLAIWAFIGKRKPDWTILKYKARLNVHGVKQKHGVNYWETYAPVVNWSTV